MAKMRVHELAKELDIQTKDITNFLSKNNVEVKSHMSTLEENEISMVKEKFGKKPAAEKPAASEENSKERPKKKATISAVYNPQNSRMGGGNRGGKNNGRNGQNRQNGNRGDRGNRSSRYADETSSLRPGMALRNPNERPAGVKKDRPAGERVNPLQQNNKKPVINATQNEQVKAETKEQPVQTNQERTQVTRTTERVDRNNRQERPSRNYGQGNDNRSYRNDRGDRNNDRGDRNNDRGERNFNRGDRNNDRGDRNFNRGDRNNDRRSYGDRPQRGDNGDRNARNDRPQRNMDKNGQGSRGGFNRNQGDRNNRPNRDGRQGQSRLDHDISRMNQSTPAEELNTKDSREKRNEKRNNNKKQDYNKREPKNQERFVNLEKKTGHKKKHQQPQQPVQEKKDEIRTIILPEIITIKDLADKMKVQPSVIVKKLFLQGEMVTVNQEITYEKAEEIALEYNCIAEPEEKIDVIAELLKEEEEDESVMVSRPPVVCVMGHVDHGKTSLLDAIRSTRVTAKEAGGITQHIGASVVSINNQNITFLDTPGHEAFTAMRMRGASSTDIAILVVAADDGVMPQTVEAINHAKAAGIEIIVAINKIDKPNANIDKVKQGLAEYELVPEDWGGSTIFVPVSAHTKEGIDTLLEMVLLTAEILELKANPKRNARGLVIEAQLDKGRGAVATVLVQKGTLKVGQPVAAGSSYGKVRAMIDDRGRRVKEAGPSMPVEILGLSSVPNAGEVFVACDSEKEARSFAETFVAENKARLVEETKSRMSLDDLFSQIQAGNLKELNLIVKADVQGSVEAVKQSLTKLSNEEVVVKVIHGGAGAINESDVILASASNAIIIGFNTKVDPTAKSISEHENVDIRLYSVIYKAIEDVEAAMKGMLDPIFEEKVLGHAEIRQIFKASGIGNIAGSYVLDGTFERGCKVRVSREGTQIFEGDLASLKRFKDDVKEVRAGYECGLVIDGFNDVQELDIVEAYKMVEVPR